jgi:hypothetical protein
MEYAMPWDSRCGGRLRLKLTPRGRFNGTLSRTIGDALERVSNARQFKCKLVDPARPLQDDNSFSTEVKSDPEHQPTHDIPAMKMS